MFSTPSGSRSASPVSVDRSLPPAQSLSQGPSTSVYNANLMTSVMRPDPRYELAWASQVPHIQTEHPDMSSVAVKAITSKRSLIRNSITSEAKKNLYKGLVVRVSASYRPNSKVVGWVWGGGYYQ